MLLFFNQKSMANYRRLVASTLLLLLPVMILLTPLSAEALVRGQIPAGGVYNRNQVVKDTVKIKDLVKELKGQLIKREPPAEPFFIRFIWGSDTNEAKTVWGGGETPLAEVNVNVGKIFVRKGIRLEKDQDKLFRKPIDRLGKANTLKIQSDTTKDYDGVELIYWKPILTEKKDITFTFKSNVFSGNYKFSELQENFVFLQDVDKKGNNLYADLRNYDTKKLEFNKARTQLVFVNWGNVADATLPTTNPEDVYRNYAVAVTMTNAKDSKIALLGTVGLEVGQNAYQIDKVVAGGETASDKVVVLSTVEGLTDGLILALGKEPFGEDALPFEQRGLHIQVTKLTEGQLPDVTEEPVVEEPAPEETPTSSAVLSHIVLAQATDDVEVETPITTPEVDLSKVTSLLDDATDLKDLGTVTKKVVFDKVFSSGEQFGVFDFANEEGDPAYGIRVTSGNFMWQNTPNVLKVAAIVTAAQTASYWLIHFATPAKLAAIGGMAALSAAYVAAVQNALFGEGYTCSVDCSKKILAEVKRDLQEQEEITKDIEDIECTTEEECKEEVAKSEAEYEDLVNEQVDQIEQDTMAAVSEQNDQKEGSSSYADIQQVVKSGTKYVGAWYYKYVEEGTALGIVKGYSDAARKGTYGPANNVNIAELLKMATIASGLQPVVIDSGAEIKAGAQWYEFYINIWTAAADMYSEVNPELAKEMRAVAAEVKAEPGKLASRLHLAKYNVLGMRVYPPDVCSNTSETCGNPTYFKDTTDKYANWLANQGVVQGKVQSETKGESLYYPQDLMNRAEAVKVEVEVAKYNGQTATGEQEVAKDETPAEEPVVEEPVVEEPVVEEPAAE